MEDYELASKSRQTDVDMLLSAEIPRTTAAAHLGGVAVECQLKALIAKYHDIAAWDECSRRKKDPRCGQAIPRPGHGLLAAVRLMDTFYRKAKADPLFLMHLGRVMNPAGATSLDFIELRYVASELDGNALNDWHESFRYVVSWLVKNEGF